MVKDLGDDAIDFEGQSRTNSNRRDVTNRTLRLNFLAEIREGIASANLGELKPAEQVLTEMTANYGL